jgi:hypothetical protein
LLHAFEGRLHPTMKAFVAVAGANISLDRCSLSQGLEYAELV